jgi:bacteriocin biosynthesis cyclodehydratase domain-containing protein
MNDPAPPVSDSQEPTAPAPGEDAAAALQVLVADENLRFPKRPRVIGDLRVFQMPDGLGMQFHFGEAPVMLRGNMTERVLSFLLGVLDGSRRTEEIVDQCPQNIPRSTLVKTMWLLHTKGMLTDAAQETNGEAGAQMTPTVVDVALERQLLFWGRHLDVTRAAASGQEIQRRLAGCRIAIVGTGIFAATTFDLLARSGSREVRVLAWDDDGLLLSTLGRSSVIPAEAVQLGRTAADDAGSALRSWIDDVDLVVTATRNAPAELFRVINRISLQHRRMWLRANIDTTRTEVGPLVDPFGSACYACLELRQRSMHELPIEDHLNQQDLARERPAGQTVPLGEALFSATLASSLLVGEVVRIATGIATPTLLNAVTTVLPVTGAIQRNTILRVPRCPECFRGQVRPPLPARSSA